MNREKELDRLIEAQGGVLIMEASYDRESETGKIISGTETENNKKEKTV